LKTETIHSELSRELTGGEVRLDTERCVKLVLMLVLTISFMLNSIPISNVVGQPELKPTEGWGMFFETTGDINITIDDPGVAVRIELPREFLEGVIAQSNRQLNNDTYFIRSDISSDYYYYTINDTSEYYPYNENAPYHITIQKPPEYTCTNVTVEPPIYLPFTPPKFVFLEGLRAPQISGIYNITVYITPDWNNDVSSPDYGKPNFSSPSTLINITQVHVSMREDPGYIFGYIIDDEPVTPIIIDTEGIVYAIEVNTGMIGRGFVDPSTGFFNITGLYAGEYRLEGSAGFFLTTGFAYSPTLSQSTYILSKGVSLDMGLLPLDRGFNITGSITYVDQLGNPRMPLDTPHLRNAGILNMTYTVEAIDQSGKIVASRSYISKNNATTNATTELYELSYRLGTKYISYPALGSEFSGFGPGTYTIKIWVYGFTLPPDQIKIVTLSGEGVSIDVGDSRLPYGGMVIGKIRLRPGPQGQLETPREGEANAFGSQTGKLFGGNILIQLYNSEGALKGVTVLKRTNETLDLPSRTSNGTVLYADYSSGDQTDLLRFYILGFSESHNKTYSGSWQIGSFPGPSPWDYGIEPGTYYIRIWIRGYIQEEIATFTISEGGNVTQTIDLRRGGSSTVTVTSNVVRPGTRWPQSPTEFWRFIDELCPPPRIRIYFYSSLGSEVGYAETILYLGGAGVLNNTAILNFTGHNWLIDDIIYRGFVPNALVADDYTLRAHTYGYIHAEDITITISLSQFSPTHVGVAFPLLLGCFIGGGVNFAMNDIFLSLTEDTPIWTHAIFDGTTLMGTYVVDAETNWVDFSFTTYGFYGRGHFFYVDPQGYRWKDYGLENGTYNILIPEFGFTRRFLQEVDTSTSLAELGWGSEVFFSLERLVKISGNIQGYNKDRIPIVLVWATIDADSRTSYSFNGDFHVHVPSETYDVIFSSPGYISQSRTGTSNDQTNLGIIVLEQSGVPFP
jgi:hypothetical protein